MNKTITIIGAGPSGLTIARELADKGDYVTIYEKRFHLGGNCYDAYDDHGVLIHPYGPHYFRSNSPRLIAWLSRFTKWRSAEYRVKAFVDDNLIPLPINFNTLTELTGECFDKPRLKKYFKEHITKIKKTTNAEEQCLNSVGSELYQKVFKNYTSKQWGIEASELSPSVTARIPIRFNYDNRYPEEEFQLIPRNGYTEMFKQMVEHPNIKVILDHEVTPEELITLKEESDILFYTGALDQYFDYKFGRLEYRSLDFKWENYPMNFYQPCVQINYPNDHDYTRTVEIKHITGQMIDSTSVCFEYPKSVGEPFYPVPSKSGHEILAKYRDLVKNEKGVYFIGRLAEYKYYNMDHVFLRALELIEKL